jgi:UDP-3-O-[3-hydroxymyristoyl] glucosamine N-acyltransferase
MADAGLTAAEVAALVGGRLVGGGAAVVTTIGPLREAGASTLSFYASPKYARDFRASRAGVVLVAEALAGEAEGPACRVVVADPYRAVQKAAESLYPPERIEPGVHPTAVIGAGAVVGREVALGPFAVVGRGAVLGDRVTLGAHAIVGDRARVGDDSVLDPRATVYPDAVLGRRVVLKTGAVVGGPGFGFMEGVASHDRRVHIGRCVLGDDVEVGSNSTVDRGSLDDTVIGDGTKLDNLVHVGHNVRIGKRCLVAAGCGFAGSVRIGDDVLIGGHTAVNGHLSIGAGARIGGASVVFGDVPAGETWSGHPARPHRQGLREQAMLGRLARIGARLEALLGPRHDA